MDPSYGQPEECLVKGRGELGGAYIVRLPCGPPETYVRKELLWPYVREFADRGIAHATNMLAAMADAGRRCELYVVHGEGGGWRGGGWCGGRVRIEQTGCEKLDGEERRVDTRAGRAHALKLLLVGSTMPASIRPLLQGTMLTRARWPC